MKIVNPAAFALVCLAVHGTGVFAKKNFTPPDHESGHGKGHITTAANFDAKGANMEVCPSGDCKNGKFMRLEVTSLTEVDAEGAEVEDKKITVFNPGNSDWLEIVTEEVNGVNVSSSTFVATLEVGDADVTFNLTASIYQGNATVEYGSQEITVPAGALKFTVDIAGWPFAADDNNLALVVSLDAKGPKSKALGKPKKNAKGKAGADPEVERVDLGDSMFMDVPGIAIIDGDVEKALVNSSVIDAAGDTAFEWVFPSFTQTLHYDPVLGDSSTTTTTTSGTTETSASASESSSGSTTDTSSTSAASIMSLPSLAAGALAALAYSLF
ncbi:unnamed protein product [Phytophthora lilii]|uniref:Unnamed protein product n=1 Tax=Phytophthora lilii TaxID=2077276 RepID=A0A9W6X756_9STRA|nr:unnamed protein product [Phytophthora lilii]